MRQHTHQWWWGNGPRFVSSGGGGGMWVDATSSVFSNTGGSGTTLTVSHPGTSPTAVAVLIGNGDNADAVVGVNYGSLSLSQIVDQSIGSGAIASAQIWGAAGSIPTGTQTVAVTYATANNIYSSVGVITVKGSSTSTLFLATHSNVGNGGYASLSDSVTSQSGAIVIALYHEDTGSNQFTTPFGTTWANSNGGGYSGFSYGVATGTSQSAAWSAGSGSDVGDAMATFHP